ncbi:serine hydrolase domain-containing protein [Streptomyces marispadix]|uniref:Beta-lactamase family protein n=1 Tax=Streptomyces marispadix TaxID=2922868 RepID=A0ABS9SWW8_9ACTN|nr:serine hydrolase domain-containing protein [Streptomyces marispadix]MCH6160751.1 beta-lactamase family protein [Streptomyces marispadix]
MKAPDAENAVDVNGTVADGYEAVRDAFASNFAERGDTGAALAVHRDGRPVVDLWAGTRNSPNPRNSPADDQETGAEDPQDDHETGDLWREGTAAVVRSVSKGPAAAVLHLLHQRGQLDLDAPVATYWPEFKSNGKERLLVRHVLAHRAGLPALDAPLTVAQATDGVSGPSALVAQAPLWEPGTDHGYHPHTFGWLVAELVRRATGRPFGRWFAEEIARPLGLSMWFGIPATPEVPDGGVDLARLTEVPTPEPSPAAGLRLRPKAAVTEAYRDPASLTRRAFDCAGPRPYENDPSWLAAGLPSAGCVATARSLSRFYAALIGRVDPPAGTGTPAAGAPAGRRHARGLTGGGRLFTPATLTQARSQESSGPDRVLVVNSRFGLGFMLHGPGAPMLAPGSFGHPGRGGSLAFADPESGTAFAYVTAAMQRSVTSDPRAHALVRALRACL